MLYEHTKSNKEMNIMKIYGMDKIFEEVNIVVFEEASTREPLGRNCLNGTDTVWMEKGRNRTKFDSGT